MVERRGATFNDLDDEEQQLVTIVVAIDAYHRARAGAATTSDGNSPQSSVWQRMARIEALRS
jgi:hypothetical protein